MKTNPLRLLVGGLVAAACTVAALGYTYIYSDSTSLPIKLPEGPWNLVIFLDNTTVLTDHSTQATSVQAAAQTWNSLLGSASLQTTISTGTPGDHNHVNEIAMAAKAFDQAFDSKTLAITTTWYSGNTRTEGDIIFNMAKSWDSYAGNLHSGIADIHRVALHELGHMLGLDHPDGVIPPQSVNAIMNSTISNIDTLTMDDITGAQNLYGPPGPPTNDNFANATVVGALNSGNTATVTGFNTLSTKEAGEPKHAGNSGGHSVWWKWTATLTGSVTVDTRGSYFDTTLAAYTGSSVGSLTTLAANDDINPGTVQASTISFNVTNGTVYYLAVDGFDADSGGIILNLTGAPGVFVPTISAQPASQTVTVGASVTFSVTADAGGSPLTYQWRANGANLPNGSTNSTYVINSVKLADSATYTVVVSTSSGSITSDGAALTVNPAPVVMPPPAPSGGGGGGGGAPSVWFLCALGSAGLARLLRRR